VINVKDGKVEWGRGKRIGRAWGRLKYAGVRGIRKSLLKNGPKFGRTTPGSSVI
jgi:hypothetical protein